MPVLSKIVIQNFRNIVLQELEFSPNINCISGGNGEGKTNLLDAIWYLSMTKSAFSASDRFNFRFGTDSFAIGGCYLMPSGTKSSFSMEVTEKDKKIRRDNKPYTRISDHIGVIPIVMVSPSDTSLVSESGDERRRFVNSVLSQTDREYLNGLQQYNKLLLQRNRLLKEGCRDEDLLCTFDLRMDSLAAPLYEKRKVFCENISPLVQEYYGKISHGGEETVGIEYRSDLQKGCLSDMLASAREKDFLLKYTGAGLQRDDFIFTMNSHPIRRYGSQGQQKSFLVALKFAQYSLMSDIYGFPPILLLDDLFDKLDMSRVSNLLAMVSGQSFGQIFITDSNKVRMKGIVDSLTEDRTYFETEGGVFSRIDD